MYLHAYVHTYVPNFSFSTLIFISAASVGKYANKPAGAYDDVTVNNNVHNITIDRK